MKEGNLIMMTRALLDDFSDMLETSQWRDKYLFQVQSIREELDSPCVLAVAGKVKAGKSFLINSLLGVDLAMTGNTETTATINVFQKGRPISPDLPVLCQWIDGRKEWKPKSFLDSLQGKDESVLQVTSKIDKLIFFVEGNPLLENVILVDTPGIGADVGDDGDSHQIQTDAYFKLRERHQSETKGLSKEADAVIYLFNTVPTETDKDFLSVLHDGGKGLTALNGVGVLSKVDKNLSQLQNVDKFSKEFESILFTIKPTSAAISKYLPSLENARKLREVLRSGFDSKEWFENVLKIEKAFTQEKLPHCTIPVEERREILKEFAPADLPWSTFKLVARELYYSEDVESTLKSLNSIAGIDGLRDLITNHFFCRSHLLRCNRVLSDLIRILSDIQFSSYFIEAEYYARIKQQCVIHCSKLEEPYKTVVVSLIEKHIDDFDAIQRAKEKVLLFKRRVEDLQAEMADVNNCYIAYQKMLTSKNDFSESEFEELTVLLNAKEMNYDCRQRQNYWSAVANTSAPNSVRQIIASIAKKRYNKLINSK